MKLYTHKPLPMGFLVLCVHHRLDRLTSTLGSLLHNYAGYPVTCVVSRDSPIEMEGLGVKVVQTEPGLANLLNAGLALRATTPWTMVVRTGTWLPPLLDRRYSFYVESERDVLYPVRHRALFDQSALHGLLVPSDIHAKVGDFAGDGVLEKLDWQGRACQSGYRFKGLFGIRV